MRWPRQFTSIRPWAAPTLVVACLLWAGPSAGQRLTGYRLFDDTVVVGSRSHWQRWSLPVHAVDLSPDGRVSPHFSRERYNVLDDRDVFTRSLTELRRRGNETAILNVDSTETLDVFGEVITDRKGNPNYTYFLRPGISRVGSNPEDAAGILDGDPTTFWEPDPDDPVDDWWVEIDLGRVVALDEVVLHFVDASRGDPFRQFRVLVAPDQEAVTQDEDGIDFVSIGGTDAPNETRRTYSLPLEQIYASPEWTGRFVQTIRVIVTESRRGRGRLLAGEDEWLELSTADRGDIAYYIRDLQGTEEPVDRDVYESLDPERQGRLDYFQRERPRLADVEAWGYGDNISPGIIDGGGSLFLSGGNFAPGPAFDGDWSTNFLHLVFAPTIVRGVLTVDMGATFWLDAMRTSASKPRPFIDGYIVRGSDGSRDTNGRLKWTRISPRSREDNSVDRFVHILDSYSDPKPLRFLEVTVVSVNPNRRGGYNTGPNIAEYQLFSSGYPAEVQFTSDLVEIPEPRHFGAITWKGQTPPGTALEIRTRSGDLLGKIVRYFDRDGQQIAFNAWKNLLGSFKGPADTTLVPTAGWSSWSRSYVEQGQRVTSPGLRRFLQFQVRMTTTDRNAAASIDSIRVELLEPVAERIFAEITPTEVPFVGILDTFVVFLQPNFISVPVRSLGFDEILLSMTASGRMELLDLEIDDGAASGPRRFTRGADDAYFDADGESLTVLQQRADSIWVRVPAQVNLLPDTSRVYHRVTVEGEQVPVTQDGLILSAPSWGLLDDDEKGDVFYFRRLSTGALIQVDQVSWEALESEAQGPVRYFRVLSGDGAQFPFDTRGDSLDAESYGDLAGNERGRVIGPGPRVRIRFQAPVFLNGTTVDIAVRQTDGGVATTAPWQTVEAGDAVPELESNSLSLSVPLSGSAVQRLTLTPNPFTPNGDGVNDRTDIGLSVFRISDSRVLEVAVYSLAGRLVWRDERIVNAGAQTIPWDGRDGQGNLVPPGIYLVRVELDVDSDRGGTTIVRTVAVAY